MKKEVTTADKRPLSLSPLSFDEAVGDILQIKPESKPPKKKAKAKKQAKKAH